MTHEHELHGRRPYKLPGANGRGVATPPRAQARPVLCPVVNAPSSLPSGWFPDPHGRYDHRWFNGTAWTADVSSDGQRMVDPLGAAPSGWTPTQGPRPGNGSAAAAITLGLIAVVLAWVPLLVVVGIVLGVLALVFGIRGLRRSREVGSGRGLAITGITTGAAALALSVVGIILSVGMIREISEFIEPADNEAAVTSCTLADGDIVVEATITNESATVDDFTLYAVVMEPPGVADIMLEVDGLGAGETREVVLQRRLAAVGECSARLVVHGPLPYGREMERVK